MRSWVNNTRCSDPSAGDCEEYDGFSFSGGMLRRVNAIRSHEGSMRLMVLMALMMARRANHHVRESDLAAWTMGHSFCDLLTTDYVLEPRRRRW